MISLAELEMDVQKTRRDGTVYTVTKPVTWYAQLVLCFVAEYADATDGRTHELANATWIDDVARPLPWPVPKYGSQPANASA